MIARALDLNNRTSYILLGPRQTGKSYLVKHLNIEPMWSVNLLLSRAFLKYSQNPHLFREESLYQIQEKRVQTIFVDEVQKLPILLDEVHQILEETACRFILTGSSARKLKRGAANFLGGRALFKRLYPLTYFELKPTARMDTHWLDSVLQFGSIAGIYQRPIKSRPQFLRSYVGTYLKEEIQLEGLVRGLPGFSRFLEVAAQSIGEVLNYSNLGRDCDQNSNTIKNYFEVLEDTLVGYQVPAWTESKRKQLSTHPKFYYFDNGVTCALLSRLIDPLDAPLRGKLFEQWIFNEVRAHLDYREKEIDLYYWRTQGGLEVDLLAAQGKNPKFAAEIKSFSNVRDEHLNPLRALRQDYPNLPLYLVHTGDEPRKVDGITVIPWREFLEEVLTSF